jgi:glycosyltransferase involved in cell wall biosynthesis
MKITPLSDPRRLRIAILGSTYPRSQTDHEVPWLRESVRRLAARGHKVTVIAPAYLGLKDHEIDGVQVRRFRYAPARWEMLTHGEGAPNKLKRNPLLKLLSLSYLVSGAWAAWKTCRRERIDVLHVHWPFPHGLMALLPGWFLRCKVVYSCHSAEFALAAGSKLATSVLAFCLHRSFAITANSAHTAGLVRQVSGREAQIIPWGATIRVDPAAQPVPQDPPLLLFSGRLIERKGVDFLLKAMPAILCRQKVRLVITGDGHCRAEWERLARSLGLDGAVAFAGFVSNAELSTLFRSCSIYVHPAIYDSKGDTEGLGVVLVEALSNGRPVVASAVGGIGDVIKDGVTGLLVPEKNPEAIAKAVLRLLDDPTYARQLGEQGYAHVCTYFNWDRIMDQYDTFIQKAFLLRARSLFKKEFNQSQLRDKERWKRKSLRYSARFAACFHGLQSDASFWRWCRGWVSCANAWTDLVWLG